MSYNDLELSITGPNGFRRNAFTNGVGKFSFHLARPGTYKVEVVNRRFFFEPVAIKIETDAVLAESPTKKQISASIWRIKDSKPTKLVYPLQLKPTHRINYFEIEQGINMLAFLKSPYMLMMGFGGLMYFMMKSVPKEELEAYQQ